MQLNFLCGPDPGFLESYISNEPEPRLIQDFGHPPENQKKSPAGSGIQWPPPGQAGVNAGPDSCIQGPHASQCISDSDATAADTLDPVPCFFLDKK